MADLRTAPSPNSMELGDEVKAEAHDVRRDKTKLDQSAGLSGTNGHRTSEVRGRAS